MSFDFDALEDEFENDLSGLFDDPDGHVSGSVGGPWLDDVRELLVHWHNKECDDHDEDHVQERIESALTEIEEAWERHGFSMRVTGRSDWSEYEGTPIGEAIAENEEKSESYGGPGGPPLYPNDRIAIETSAGSMALITNMAIQKVREEKHSPMYVMSKMMAEAGDRDAQAAIQNIDDALAICTLLASVGAQVTEEIPLPDTITGVTRP